MNLRKFSQLIGIACLVIASITVASAQNVILDNYETTPAGVTVGNPPPNPYPGPYTLFGTGGVSGVTVVSGVSVSGNNSLQVKDADTTSLITGFNRNVFSNMVDGRLSFDFRFDSSTVLSGPMLQINSALGVSSAPWLKLIWSKLPAGPDAFFQWQSASGSPFVLNFPTGVFQHIEIGWSGADSLGGVLKGLYYMSWNGTTNFFTPIATAYGPTYDIKNIQFVQGFNSSFSPVDEYTYYIDNLQLAIPEPSVAALSLISGIGALFLRRAAKR